MFIFKLNIKCIGLFWMLCQIPIVPCQAQVVSSNCFAPDSIVDLYSTDADRMTIRRFYAESMTYTDSVIVPNIYSDTILGALIAIYNADGLDARDTVVDLFHVHTFPDIVMNSFVVKADSGQSWMNQLEMNQIPTGNSQIDDVLLSYNFYVGSYQPFGNALSYHYVEFQTDSNYNLYPLFPEFVTVPGVLGVYPNGYVGDGNDIVDSIFSDRVRLDFSVGWGDCGSGCMYRRYWAFNVYFNCDVEYIGSYGDILPVTGFRPVEDNNLETYPNPVKDVIHISNDDKMTPINFHLYSIAGQLIKFGIVENNQIDLSEIIAGQYVLKVSTDQSVYTTRIIKE